MKIILFLLFSSCMVFSQQLSSTSIYKNKSSEQHILDGKLDENFWKQALKFTEFKQTEPSAGDEASENTEVYLSYDEENIYIGFVSFVEDKTEIYSSVLERDRSLNIDDYVEVVIDSRNDNSNQLSFKTNLLGARTDAEVTNNGGVFNNSWNTFWDAKSTQTDYGWTTEFVIPLSSLRYKANEKTVIGFKFIRNIKAKNETVTFPLFNSNLDKLTYNQLNSIKIEFNDLESKTPIYVTPYLTNNFSSKYKLNQAKTAYVNETDYLNRKNYFNNETLDKILSNVGLDLKYKINNRTSLDLTLNTDFAQAEADDRIINLSRYSISLPEKRNFFLENADFFKSSLFDHILFHSRRIGIEKGTNVPIIGGLRLVGSVNNFEYGLLNMFTHSSAINNIDAKNFTVMRFKNKFGNDESYIGGIFTNVSSTDKNEFNRLGSIDGFFRFDNSITAAFFGASSFDKGEKAFRNNAYGIRINRFPYEGLEFDVRFRDYQENFNPAAGIVLRPNTKNLVLRAGYKFALNNNSWLSRLVIGNYNTFFWISSTNQREFQQYNTYVTAILKDGSVLTFYLPYFQRDNLIEPWNFSSNITIPVDDYKMAAYEIRYSSGYGEVYNWNLNAIIGDFYGGSQIVFSPGLNYIFNKNFNIELLVDYNRLTFPESFSKTNDGTEVRVLYSAKFNYFFSSEFSLKAFFQYDNLSESIGTNFRMRYNPKEGTNLYLVFNQNINSQRERFTPAKPFIDNQTLILKYSQTFIF